MFKMKLFSIICGVTSVAVAASTALTLAVSGPRNTQSLHLLSDNEAVAAGLSNVFGNSTAIFDTVTEMVDTISSNKTSLSGNITINHIEDLDELSGFGAGFQIDVDGDNGAAALIAEATLGSMKLFDGTLYLDTEELIAQIPILFEGIIKAPIDNLEEDIKNSFIGQTFLSDFDLDEFMSEYTAAMEEMQALMPETDFDYEAFAEELSDVVEDAWDEVIANMDVTDNGNIKLNGGSYQSYRAGIPVEELSYIVKDVIVFVLTDEEFLAYIEEIYNSSMLEVNIEGDDEYSDIYGGMSTDISDSLSSIVPMLESSWGMVVTSIEKVLGENVEFTMHLTEAVEVAGFDFFVAQMDSGRISYDKSDLNHAVGSITFSADMTGGAKIGDYADISMIANADEYTSYELSSISKTEENGDFSHNSTITAYGETMEFSVEGSSQVNGQYFNCTVDSLKFTVDDQLVMDIGFNLAFQPIDSVTKPSGSPEYNVWEMDMDDFGDLMYEIEAAFEDISSVLD